MILQAKLLKRKINKLKRKAAKTQQKAVSAHLALCYGTMILGAQLQEWELR